MRGYPTIDEMAMRTGSSYMGATDLSAGGATVERAAGWRAPHRKRAPVQRARSGSLNSECGEVLRSKVPERARVPDDDERAENSTAGHRQRSAGQRTPAHDHH